MARHYRLQRRVRFVLPRELMRKANANPLVPEGVPGFVTAGVFTEAPIEISAQLDEAAAALRSVGSQFERFVSLAQEAHELSAKLAATLAELGGLELAPGCSWASPGERARLDRSRYSLSELAGLEATTSPVPVFTRDIPAKYWAVEFFRDKGLTVENAHDAVSLSESATRKFWRDYNGKDAADPLQVCTYCGALHTRCVCRPVTATAPQ